MRKLIMFNAITLDGFFAGPNDELDWHRTDEEFNQFAIEQTQSAGTLIFGRRTYQMMADYWTGPAAQEDDPIIMGMMNMLPKVVISRTLQSADWHNTHLVKTDVAGEINRLKQQLPADLFVFGSANLSASMIREGLFDEYRLLVHPIVLGRGRPLFEDVDRPLNLALVDTRKFKNGNLLLTYQPE